MRAYFVLGSPTTLRDRKSEVSIITAAAAALMIVKRKMQFAWYDAYLKSVQGHSFQRLGGPLSRDTWNDYGENWCENWECWSKISHSCAAQKIGKRYLIEKSENFCYQNHCKQYCWAFYKALSFHLSTCFLTCFYMILCCYGGFYYGLSICQVDMQLFKLHKNRT